MENNQQNEIKCSLEEHIDKKAIKECEFCNMKLCNECCKIHSKFLPNHNLIIIDKTNPFNFKSTCSYKNHINMSFNYYCENHNELCVSDVFV